MIEVICVEDSFLVKGTFSFGIAGVFENEDFMEDGAITIDDTRLDILEELSREHSVYQPLLPYLRGKEDGAAIARGLADYYNQKEQEVQRHIKQINDCILYHLFEDLENCEYPFWEIEEAVLPGSLEGVDLDSIYDTEESVSDWWEEFYEQPNNGTLSKTDVEGKLRAMFPMFDFDGLYRSILPMEIALGGRFIEVTFSDGWGQDLLCSAYDRFDENFTSCDWNNH